MNKVSTPRHSTRRALGWATTLTVLLTTSPIVAQGGRYEGTSEAQQAFDRGQFEAAEGDRLLREGESEDAFDAYEDAIEYYEEALEIDAEFEEARERLAYVLYVINESEEAIEILEDGLDENPTSVPLRRMLGINLYQLGEHTEAVEILQTIEAEGGATSDVLFILAVHFYDAEAYEQAAPYFQSYLVEIPYDADSHGALGNCYLRTNQYDLALEAFRTVLELDPENLTARENMGDVFFASGQFRQAIEVYIQVLPEDPDNYRVWFNLGRAYVELEAFEEGLASFERFVELRDDLYQGHYYLGYAMYELDRLVEAQQALERAIELRDDHSMSFYRLGLVELGLSNNEAAIASLEQARELAPDEGWFAWALGDAYLEDNRVDEAIEQHLFALETDPTIADFHASLGRDYIQTDNLAEAATSLEEALVLDSTHEQAARGLSVVLLRRAQSAISDGQLDDARDDLTRADELGQHPLHTAIALASLALTEDDLNAAETVLDSIAASYGEELSYRRARAYLLLQQGQPERIGDELADVREVPIITIDPRDAALLGHWAANDEDWSQALEFFNRASDGESDYDDEIAYCYLRMGIRDAERSRFGDANENLDEALDRRNDLSRASVTRLEYAVGMTALHLENYSRAARHLESAIRAFSELSDADRRDIGTQADLELDLHLAYALYQSGDFDGAVGIAASLSGDDATELLARAHERLARQAYESDDLEEARDHLEAALDVLPSSSVAQNNLACLLYGEGEDDRAGEIFRELAEEESVTNAIFNYAVYLDEIDDDPEGAYQYYQLYVENEGEAEDEALELMRLKEEVFGF